MKPTIETPLVLASPAPRHAAMLAGAGLPDIRIRETHWTRGTGESCDDVARRAAEEAARAEDAVALGCAWTLSIDGTTLDVPRDAADARRMLARIAGQTPTISAAWAIADADGVRRAGHAEATLHLRAASDDAFDRYAATGEAAACPGALDPLRSGMRFVDRCEGDWTTALGMPLSDVLDALTAEGLTPPPASPVARRAALLGGRIMAACAAADRPRSSVRLVGASKAQPSERLSDALQAGVRDLGESYVQEWQEKFSAFADADPGPVWHYIGRVQRNKARPIGRMAQLVHGVHAARTAKALAKVALDEGRGSLPILVQVDLAGEESKGGAAPHDLESLLTDIAGINGVRVDGLMTLPPQEGLAGARARFAQLRALRDALATPDRPLPVLSMGMSGDFEAAIAEGATHVRVGTALFGPRPRA